MELELADEDDKIPSVLPHSSIKAIIRTVLTLDTGPL